MKVYDGYLIRDFLEELTGDIERYVSIRLRELDDIVKGRKRGSVVFTDDRLGVFGMERVYVEYEYAGGCGVRWKGMAYPSNVVWAVTERLIQEFVKEEDRKGINNVIGFLLWCVNNGQELGRVLGIYRERIDLFVSLVAEALRAEEEVVEGLRREYEETSMWKEVASAKVEEVLDRSVRG
jgi:hypothetical protein